MLVEGVLLAHHAKSSSQGHKYCRFVSHSNTDSDSLTFTKCVEKIDRHNRIREADLIVLPIPCFSKVDDASYDDSRKPSNRTLPAGSRFIVWVKYSPISQILIEISRYRNWMSRSFQEGLVDSKLERLRILGKTLLHCSVSFRSLLTLHLLCALEHPLSFPEMPFILLSSWRHGHSFKDT